MASRFLITGNYGFAIVSRECFSWRNFRRISSANSFPLNPAMLIGPLESITEDHLRELVTSAASESATLDFKRQVPGNSAKEKFEFVKDVCAMANAAGGDLVYGIAEVDGAANGLVPIIGEPLDALQRRLGLMIDAGIEPRITGLQMRTVHVAGGDVLVVRVPASFTGPHRVIVDGHSKFVARNHTHTTELSYDQLRIAFDRMSTLADRAHKFNAQRLDSVAAGRTWRPLIAGPVARVCLIPIESMAGRRGVDVQSVDYADMRLSDWPGTSMMSNLDGLVAHVGGSRAPDQEVSVYTQLFRNGVIESVRTARLTVRDDKIIPSLTVARYFRDAYAVYTQTAQKLGLAGPAIFSCAILNTSGFSFGTRDVYAARSTLFSDRQHLVLPEGWIDALSAPPPVDTLMKPMLDVLWEAFDLPRCELYDAEGRWKGA